MGIFEIISILHFHKRANFEDALSPSSSIF